MGTLPPPEVRIAFDVDDLDRTCAFYARVLDFKTVATSRAGLIFESRVLRSPIAPAVELDIRAGFGKRTQGMSPGGVTRFSIRVPNLANRLPALEGAPIRWVGPAPAAGATPASVVFLDPDAYQVELFT